MNIRKNHFTWIFYCLLFPVIIWLSGCINTQRVSTSECDKKPSQSIISSLENFEETYRKILKNYVEPSDELTELQEQTLNSLEKLDNYPLYIMHYYADYHLNEFIKVGVKDLDSKKIKTPECTCFSALNKEGEIIYGRNLDYDRLPLLILFTHPQRGYSSVSIIPIVVAYSNENLHLAPIEEKRALLYSPYFTVDGMNEHGFSIAEMEVPGEKVFDPDKISLISLHIQRLLLDQAKNVDEAITLLKKYNNLDSHRIHFLMADSSGKSAIIEYCNGDIVITNSLEPWQVSTNFLVLNKPVNELVNLCSRYSTAYYSLKNSNGKITMYDALTILKNVSVLCRTQHSLVYNLSTGKIELAVGRNYDKTFNFIINKNL